MMAVEAKSDQQRNEVLNLLKSKLNDPEEDSFVIRNELRDAIERIEHPSISDDNSDVVAQTKLWQPALVALAAALASAIITFYVANIPDPFAPPAGASADIQRAHSCLQTKGTKNATATYQIEKSSEPGCFGVVIAACNKEIGSTEIECLRREEAAWVWVVSHGVSLAAEQFLEKAL